MTDETTAEATGNDTVLTGDQGADKAAPETETKTGDDQTGDDSSDESKDENADTDDASKDGEDDGAKDDADKDGDDESEDDGEKEDDTDADDEEWKLDAPEGMEAFQEDLDKFAGEMGDWLKANPEASAKEALAEAARRQAQLAVDAQKEGAEAFDRQVADWEKEARADKEIGGAKFDENAAIAVKALHHIDTYVEVKDAEGNPVKDKDGNVVKQGEIALFLNNSGLGSHPAFIRGFHKIGKLISDAGLADEDQGGGGQGDTLKSRYPNSQAG